MFLGSRIYFLVTFLSVFLLSNCKSDNETNITESMTTYQDEWVIRMEGGPQVASLLALQSGYKNLGLVRTTQNLSRPTFAGENIQKRLLKIAPFFIIIVIFLLLKFSLRYIESNNKLPKKSFGKDWRERCG